MSSRNAKIVSCFQLGLNCLERGPLAQGKQGRHQWVALFPSLCLDNGIGLACGWRCCLLCSVSPPNLWDVPPIWLAITASNYGNKCPKLRISTRHPQNRLFFFVSSHLFSRVGSGWSCFTGQLPGIGSPHLTANFSSAAMPTWSMV